MAALSRVRRRLSGIVAGWRHAFASRLWGRPAAAQAAGTGTELPRSRAQLLAEDAILRQQRIVLHRHAMRPASTSTDRALLTLLAGRVRAWWRAVPLVRPDTVLRWHRAGSRSLWRGKSRRGPGRPPPAGETIAPIRRMAADNPLRGAERPRGERGKPGLRVGKRTIQTSRRGARTPRPPRQAWATFLHNRAPDIRACDFPPVTDPRLGYHAHTPKSSGFSLDCVYHEVIRILA